MLYASLLLASLHPMLLSIWVVLMALSVTATGSAAAMAISAATILAAPLAASSAVATIYSWCFSARCKGALPVLTAAFALIAVLNDESSVRAMTVTWSGSSMSAQPVLSALAGVTSSACLATAVVMICALLVELPLRWAAGTFASLSIDVLAQTVRLLALLLTIGLAWPLLRSLAADTLQKLFFHVGA